VPQGRVRLANGAGGLDAAEGLAPAEGPRELAASGDPAWEEDEDEEHEHAEREQPRAGRRGELEPADAETLLDLGE
jgi:hypothetical protein